MDVKGSQMGQAWSRAKDQDYIQMFGGESLEKSKFKHSVYTFMKLFERSKQFNFKIV